MAEILMTLIWTGVLGLAVGNYATSFVYRLPKAESPFTKHPYCGGCGTMLQVKDLYPALSWLLLRGKCRYCQMEIPSVYFWTEIFCAVIFMLGALSLGFSEPYLLVITAGTCLVTLWALEARVNKLYYILLIITAATGVIYRTLLDGTIYDAFYGTFLGAGLPLVWWRLRQPRDNQNGEKERMVIPHSVALGATAGAWLAPFGLIVFVVIWGVLAIVYKLISRVVKHWPAHLLSPAYVFALMTVLIYPCIIDAAGTFLSSFSR